MTFSVVLKAFQVVLGSWNPELTICPFRARMWPFQAPKTLRFKGKCETKNTIKQGKTPKGQMVLRGIRGSVSARLVACSGPVMQFGF